MLLGVQRLNLSAYLLLAVARRVRKRKYAELVELQESACTDLESTGSDALSSLRTGAKALPVGASAAVEAQDGSGMEQPAREHGGC